MNLCWLTDIHLNFLEFEDRVSFYKTVTDTKSDIICITGDIAEAPSICDMLLEMEESIKKPIYFVLGNHDYYRGQIVIVRSNIKIITQKYSSLHWLTGNGAITLTDNTVLVGCDGWSDGRYGDYWHSNVILNDSVFIKELNLAYFGGKKILLEKMQKLALIDAKILTKQLEEVFRKNFKQIIVLTHVPPFEKACTYGGEVSNKDWLPLFSSKILGDVLLDFAKRYPRIDFLVLCGHSHSSSDYNELENLHVKTGKAEYYQPEIQEIIEL